VALLTRSQLLKLKAVEQSQNFVLPCACWGVAEGGPPRPGRMWLLPVLVIDPCSPLSITLLKAGWINCVKEQQELPGRRS
jgi:hypothetical protein